MFIENKSVEVLWKKVSDIFQNVFYFLDKANFPYFSNFAITIKKQKQ